MSREQLLTNYTDGKMNISEVIKILKHDEHIDFATRSKMINKVFTIIFF
jgi:hypothetical protein